jgi:hypothetical protein
MQRPLGSPALSDCISRFESELRAAVWEIARAVLAQELSRRTAAERAPRTNRARAVNHRRAAPARRARGRAAPAELITPAIVEVVAPPPVETANDASDDSDAPPLTVPGLQTKSRGRAAWTRDRVVDELATWVIQDPVIDAATLSRRGQSSLVAAARRLFGRFDAALNAAHLRISELYPDGPPKRGGRVPVAA